MIPVHNEGQNIRRVLWSLSAVRTPLRVLICYDADDDDTLLALDREDAPFPIELVKNRGRGALGAVVTGLQASRAPAVLVMPADDEYNAPRIDGLVRLLEDGNAIVTPSRFILGGCLEDCPLVKAVMLRSAAFFLRHVARLPTHDATNGFRLFSRRVVDRIPIESTTGFTYSLELLVKAHRLGWRVAEAPVEWHERTHGTSRFRPIRWTPAYLRWVAYALATTFLRRGPATVRLREAAT